MTDTAQIEMKLHSLTDKLSQIANRLDKMEKLSYSMNDELISIRNRLLILEKKL